MVASGKAHDLFIDYAKQFDSHQEGLTDSEVKIYKKVEERIEAMEKEFDANMAKLLDVFGPSHAVFFVQRRLKSAIRALHNRNKNGIVFSSKSKKESVMPTRKEYEEFLARVAKSTGLDAFAPDKDGLVSLRVEETYTLSLQYVERSPT